MKVINQLNKTGYMNEEVVTIEDNRGFQYRVLVDYSPEFGFAVARYKGNIIGDCQLNRILPPFTDDDREHEQYQERITEWRDEILVNLRRTCEIFFRIP